MRLAGLAGKPRLWVTVTLLWAIVHAQPAQAPTIGPGERRVVAATVSFVAASIRPPAPAAPVLPPVMWPAKGQLTGWYGERRGAQRHPGVDIDGATGDPVVAAAAGRVTAAGPAPAGLGGYGTVVIIDHGGGMVSISAHLSKVMVRTGQQVKPGDRIGSIGTTGFVTGSHLHFELRRNGVAVNPKPWLNATTT